MQYESMTKEQLIAKINELQQKLQNQEMKNNNLNNLLNSANNSFLEFNKDWKYALLSEAEEQVRISNERFAKAFNANPAASAITRLKDDIIVDVNDSFLKLFGYSREEVIGVTPTILGTWIESEARLEMLSMLKKQGQADSIEIDIRKKSGERATVILSTALIELGGDEHIVGSMVDISERKVLEKQLKQTNQKMFNILDGITEGFFALDREGQFTYVNKHQCLALNKKREEVLGKSIWQLFPKSLNSKLYKEYHKAMTERIPVQFEMTSVYEDAYYEIRAFPYDDGISVFIKNITEKKKYQKEISRLSYLNLIGQMAAGISHEVRNPLTTVRGFLQMLRGKDECSKFNDYFELMIEELDRTNSIITEYLSMTKSKSEELEMQNLNTIVETILPLIQADAVGQDKYVESELHDIPDILLDSKEIRQLILNLCRNGLESMGRGKRLKIITSRKIIVWFLGFRIRERVLLERYWRN
ncbi:hypothetical protein N752_06240 [Desulforamulus aquiferis]|nr:hypothetical protein N752_06240 [Desulforamulus aquiferis]